MIDPRTRYLSESTWAQNRWPAIGLWCGAGVGVAAGVLLGAGWVRTILLAAGLGVGGLLVGHFLAKALSWWLGRK